MKSILSKKKPFGVNRRRFLRDTALSSMAVILGTDIVFGHNLPKGMSILGLENISASLPGKDGRMTILNDRPINAETPPYLLDDKITPGELFFVRNNGIAPVDVDVNNWTLTIGGESAKKEMVFSLAELKSKFKQYTYQLTLECGGNGRKEFNPPAKGNQWGLGAVGCAEWTGVRLKDVLESVGMKSNAVYIGYYGADSHLSGNPDKDAISRGVPINKAMEDESLIAWAMNGEDIPMLNGHPLRLVFGGWPASCSGKWLNKIVIRNKVHDGVKMIGQAYRIPCDTVEPGKKVADEDMCIIESMPVKSLITFPKSGGMISLSEQLPIRGHAWAGDQKVSKVEYSIDFGATWKPCEMTNPVNRHAWQHFNATVSFPKVGYYEVWAKATDESGTSQPMILPGWNPKGYLNNACHRIAIKVNK
ncbi:MAG: DMSO/TMAO reductase YedYZ molybdopterin-dependent catalytic subunit [Saprospiraceae bacterium]|jgi:DMSO/TMAO reductase YedYZ molybdopterin-dependent catalytic subunit